MSETEFTEGVCGDGAVILRDGERMTISDVLESLTRLTARVEALRERLKPFADEANEETYASLNDDFVLPNCTFTVGDLRKARTEYDGGGR